MARADRARARAPSRARCGGGLPVGSLKERGIDVPQPYRYAGSQQQAVDMLLGTGTTSPNADLIGVSELTLQTMPRDRVEQVASTPVLSREVTQIMKRPTVVSPLAMAIAVGISMGIGVFFGFYPARKASRLNPIVALRYEWAEDRMARRVRFPGRVLALAATVLALQATSVRAADPVLDPSPASPVAPPEQKPPAKGAQESIDGRWVGGYTNTVGESGDDEISLAEDAGGAITGLWSGTIQVEGHRTGPRSFKLTGRNARRAYTIEGRLNDAGSLMLEYVSERLDAPGSYNGTSMLQRAR